MAAFLHISLTESIDMQYRTFGRTGWKVSEIGYGMWGMGGWSGSDDAESMEALELSVRLGCNFFDTAWAYGQGHSESCWASFFATTLTRNCTCTKIPPKNRVWPSRPEFTLDDDFPPDYILEYVEKSRENIGVDTLDLIQFHVWEDGWADDARWQKAVTDLKDRKLVSAIGVSVNRWEPDNVLNTLRTA
jgi:aryl-alcohol dehydrogenase-like predicted oxidoreductase